jgi:hypothetical protein
VVPTLSIPVVPDCLLVGASFPFSAALTGLADTRVAWSVQESGSGATIDAAGRFTAPAAPGTCHVVATSLADATLTAMAAVPVRYGTLAPGAAPSADLTVTDLAYLMGAMGSQAGARRYNPGADFDGDGSISLDDLKLFLASF